MKYCVDQQDVWEYSGDHREADPVEMLAEIDRLTAQIERLRVIVQDTLKRVAESSFWQCHLQKSLQGLYDKKTEDVRTALAETENQ